MPLLVVEAKLMPIVEARPELAARAMPIPVVEAMPMLAVELASPKLDAHGPLLIRNYDLALRDHETVLFLAMLQLCRCLG
jgi:hypothetical protein